MKRLRCIPGLEASVKPGAAFNQFKKFIRAADGFSTAKKQITARIHAVMKKIDKRLLQLRIQVYQQIAAAQ